MAQVAFQLNTKDYKSKFPKPLSGMISSSFTTGIFPNALNVANVIYNPIYKDYVKLCAKNVLTGKCALRAYVLTCQRALRA